jgi:hypothetical protein
MPLDARIRLLGIPNDVLRVNTMAWWQHAMIIWLLINMAVAAFLLWKAEL